MLTCVIVNMRMLSQYQSKFNNCSTGPACCRGCWRTKVVLAHKAVIRSYLARKSFKSHTYYLSC